MSLIVARTDGDNIYMMGDTELTYRNDNLSNPIIDGCLKQYIVHDQLAISFAGIREHFELIYKSFTKCKTGSDIVDIAINSQKKGYDFELLVAEIGSKTITTIKEGSIQTATVGYIGSHQGFEKYQEYYHNYNSSDNYSINAGRATMQFLQIPEPAEDSGIYAKMYQCLKNVILDGRIEGVGGVVIPLCSHKGKFAYMIYADIVSDMLKISELTQQPKPISFGTAQGGACAIDFEHDEPFGGSGKEVGLYFLQGGFGVIFPESESGLRNAKLIKAKTQAYWILETKKELGHGIASSFLTSGHCGVAGEELLKAEKWQDALFIYELGINEKGLKEKSTYDRYIAGYGTALFNCGQQKKAIRFLEQETAQYPNLNYSTRMLQKMKSSSTL